MGYVLIGTEASQFTGKVRAFLRWRGVSFRQSDATPEVYRDIIEPRIGYAVIPVLLTHDASAIQDSAEIIDFIDRAESGPSVHPSGPVQNLVSLLLELYADEWLVIPAMHYRWSHDDAWIVAEFGRTAAPGASHEAQVQIGQVIAKPVRDAVPRFGVSEETMSGIEAHFEGFLADCSAHLRKTPFMLGNRPSLGDFALFGALYGPIYLDPTPGERMRRLAPAVVDWIERVQSAKAGEEALLADDAVPVSLHPILKRQMSEQLPVLIDTVKALQEWTVAQPKGARIPRSFGTHEFMIGGRRGERNILSFALWRLQRVQDHYLSLGAPDQARADALLDAIGGRWIAQHPLPVRIERKECRLVIA
jgi:glutathione S-transferase